MQSWRNIFPKNTGLSIYVWIIFCILPFYFYFIFHSLSFFEVAIGVLMIIIFFIAYRFSFISKGWRVYFWVAIQILISIGMTLIYGYVYFAIFLAFFIGNIQNKIGFFTLYFVHLTTTIVAVNISFFTQREWFLTQFPFIVISVIGVILLPFNTYNKNRQEKLEGQLEVANQTISKLIVIEERQRIARDLHDVLGQKLSLIGLKSDLASKLINIDPTSAINEINDVQHTARTALKEVREMVSGMRESKLEDELIRIQQMLNAARIKFSFEGSTELSTTPLVENMISMCLKEAVTNIVKHSEASICKISIVELEDELKVRVEDDGIGFPDREIFSYGSGLKGIKERLEFVNGSLNITQSNGTLLEMLIPQAIQEKNGSD